MKSITIKIPASAARLISHIILNENGLQTVLLGTCERLVMYEFAAKHAGSMLLTIDDMTLKLKPSQAVALNEFLLSTPTPFERPLQDLELNYIIEQIQPRIPRQAYLTANA